MSGPGGVEAPVYSQFGKGLSDGLGPVARQLARNVTGAKAYGDGLAEVFGPLPEAGGSTGFVRENVSLQAMNAAYANKQLDILVATYELMLDMYPSAVAQVLPTARTDNLTIHVFKFNADRSIMEITPEFAPARVVTQGTTEFTQVLERRARSIEMGNGFWMTEEGKMSLAMKQAVLRAIVLATMDAERYFAIFNAQHSDLYRKAVLSNNDIPYNDVLELFGSQSSFVGCIQREQGFDWLDTKLDLAFDQGAVPDTYFVPPGFAVTVTKADKTYTEYNQNGPGNTRYRDEGRRAILTFKGKRLIEVPTMVIDDWNMVENMSTRVRALGFYNGVYDPNPGCEGYTTGRTDTLIYDMKTQTDGSYKRVTMKDVVENCGVFDGDGWSSWVIKFVEHLNKNKNLYNVEIAEHLGLPVVCDDGQGSFRLAETIGDIPLPLLSADACDEIVGTFIEKLDVNSEYRTAIVDGVQLMADLSRPDLMNDNVGLYVDAVAAAVANSATGLAAVNNFGTLPLASIKAPTAAGPTATRLKVATGDLAKRYADALKQVLPYGYGTWAGMQTLAAGSWTGGADPAGMKKKAEDFVKAVRAVATRLSGIFERNPAFELGFCPFWLRGGTSILDQQLCVFVHALLARHITPTYVLVTGTGTTANTDKLFTSPSAAKPADTQFESMNAQLAYALGQLREWQLATEGADANEKRDKLNSTFLSREGEWAGLLGININTAATPEERGARVANVFADRYLAAVGATSAVLRRDGGGYESALKLAINAIRYNLNLISLPPGSVALDGTVLETWRTSKDARYRIVTGGASLSESAITVDLNNALDFIAAGGTITDAWINTRLYISNEAYVDFAKSLESIPVAATRTTFVNAIPFRPANQEVLTVPLTGAKASGLNDDEAEELLQMFLQLEMLDVTDPARGLLALDEPSLQGLDYASKLTRIQYQLEMSRLGEKKVGSRFQSGDHVVTRWRELQMNVTDPLTRAVAIMYTLQELKPSVLKRMLKESIPLPFEGGLARPLCRYNFGAIALVQGGEQLGNLYICNDQVIAGNNHHAGIWTLTYSINFAAVIHDHNLLIVVPDVAVMSYRSGQGCDFVNPLTKTGDMYALMLPYGANLGRTGSVVYNNKYPIDLRGKYTRTFYNDYLAHDAKVDWKLPTYASWAFYNFLYEFDRFQTSNPFAFERFSEVRDLMEDNTVCYQGPQFLALNAHSCELEKYEADRGPFGPWWPKNMKTVLKLPSNMMLKNEVPPGIVQQMEN